MLVELSNNIWINTGQILFISKDFEYAKNPYVIYFDHRLKIALNEEDYQALCKILRMFSQLKNL